MDEQAELEIEQPAVEAEADTMVEEESYECPECGTAITPDMATCPNCGVGLTFEESADETPAASHTHPGEPGTGDTNTKEE